jgi:hypothetical protein
VNAAFIKKRAGWRKLRLFACAYCRLIWKKVAGDSFARRLLRWPKPSRTDTSISLARQMYDSRDFSAMPILTDALQDAGGDNADIFEHCRGTGATRSRVLGY